jgi:hypothetical protein
VAFGATQRIALVGGAASAVRPPRYFRSLTIGNAGLQDFLVYSTLNDDDTTFVIGAGWERTILLPSEHDRFRLDEVVCWVKCSVDATVVLLWM